MKMIGSKSKKNSKAFQYLIEWQKRVLCENKKIKLELNFSTLRLFISQLSVFSGIILHLNLLFQFILNFGFRKSTA